MTDFGIKELYSVTLRPTLDMEINGVQYQENEPIISFEKIQMATLNENKRKISARGGYGNQTWITWETTTNVVFNFTEGVISKEGLSIISNSKILTRNSNDFIVPYNEFIEVQNVENQCQIKTKFSVKDNLFIKFNGKKITDYVLQSDKQTILINSGVEEYDIVTVYYDYIYIGKSQIFSVGERAIPGFLSLTGRMRVKDDQTGKESTALITIPKLKLTSDLSMRLGNTITPMIYNFQMVGYPVGDRSTQHVCEIVYLLDEDIDADF